MLVLIGVCPAEIAIECIVDEVVMTVAFDDDNVREDNGVAVVGFTAEQARDAHWQTGNEFDEQSCCASTLRNRNYSCRVSPNSLFR